MPCVRLRKTGCCVPQIASKEIAELTTALSADPDLRQLRDEIERLHHVVFHTEPDIDWSRVRGSADQILIAEIVSRHHGHPTGLRDALRAMEAAGTPHAAAVSDLATQIHSYYTTPLGVVMRQNLFGQRAVFILPDAYEWKDRQLGHSTARDDTAT